jgi:extracellular solute-binding protein (family 5)
MGPKSPWHDRRVRLAANYAIDRNAINRAETLGLSKITGSVIPSSFDFYWQPPGYPFDPGEARRLLAAAGYPNGFDAGVYSCDASYANVAEAVVNYLDSVGIRTQLRPLERAAFFAQFREKKLKNIIQAGSGAFGNAATRIEAFVAAGGAYVYGSDPDIDGLFRAQASETDRKQREARVLGTARGPDAQGQLSRDQHRTPGGRQSCGPSHGARPEETMFGLGKVTCYFCERRVSGKEALRGRDSRTVAVCLDCYEKWEREGRTCVMCRGSVQGPQQVGASSSHAPHSAMPIAAASF